MGKAEAANGALSLEDQSQALHTLNYALTLPQAWPDVCKLLLILAPQMEQAGYRDEWIPYLTQGIEQCQTHNDIEAQANLQFHLGILYELQGKYEQAHIELARSATSFKTLNIASKQASTLNRLAQVARRRNQFEEAKALVKSALHLLAEEDTERAYSYLVLGLIAFDNRSLAKAIDFFQTAFNIWQIEDNQRMMAWSLTNIGATLRLLEKYPDAIASYQQAITLLKTIQDPIHQAVAEMNLGNIYLTLNKMEEALPFYIAAEGTFYQILDRLRLAQINHNMGMVYRRLEQWSQAEYAFLNSIKHRQKLGNASSPRNIIYLANSLNGLGLVYLAQGKSTEAKTTLERGLSVLAQAENEPEYQTLFEMITTDIQKLEIRN